MNFLNAGSHINQSCRMNEKNLIMFGRLPFTIIIALILGLGLNNGTFTELSTSV